MSAALKRGAATVGAAAWLKCMEDSLILLGAILKVVHPELYHTSLAGLLTLGGREPYEPVLQQWGTPFNALSIIVNRQAPLHRDTQTRNEWYDMLLSIGDYSSAELHLPGLGLDFTYPSGTMVIFSGSLLRHGVTVRDADRICIAHYMRDVVQDRLQTDIAGWATVADIENIAV